MKTVIALTPELYRLFKWLQVNASTDPARLSINAINIKFNRIEATNGFVAVVAILEAPIKYYADLDDGQWFIESITKKSAILIQAEDLNYPDISVILNKLHLVDNHVLACINPALITQATKGFDKACINIHNSRSAVEIVLQGDDFPDGKYIAVVMPMYTDYEVEAVMTDAFSKLVSDKS